jgi:hypothetical protein
MGQRPPAQYAGGRCFVLSSPIGMLPASPHPPDHDVEIHTLPYSLRSLHSGTPTLAVQPEQEGECGWKEGEVSREDESLPVDLEIKIHSAFFSYHRHLYAH